MNTPISKELVESVLEKMRIRSIGTASIREVKKLINLIEEQSGVPFVRMEMGVPGIAPARVGVEAQIAALKKGVAQVYPPVEGLPELKQEAARFVKNFLDIDINPEFCVPSVGSMQAGFAALMTINRMYKEREGTLFIDPGFPVQKTQCRLLGQDFRSFDVYDFRGAKLRDKLESMMADGKVSSILYSNPNNPAWICLTDEELQIIGEVANKYNAIVIEDLAYFAMDFRKDYSKPGQAPYQPTVAKYTDNYVMLISSSKAFSYAGERAAFLAISEKIWNTMAPDLKRYHSTDRFGDAFIYGTMYALSSGVPHSVQYALWAMLKAANDGTYDFVKAVHEYGEKAQIMKQSFCNNGFTIVYDRDGDDPIADGFYFTFNYPNYTGEALLKELLCYGISAISLGITGSTKEGIRACVSLIPREQFPLLEERLKLFHTHHSA